MANVQQIRISELRCRRLFEAAQAEFIFILSDASRVVTFGRAERICEPAKPLRMLFDGHGVTVATLSIGAAVLPEHGQTSTAISRAADAALHRAKQAGRNCVIVAG